MADHPIAVYLSDHLAGATVALELLDHLQSAHSGTPLASTLAGLRGDVEADRQVLLSLAGRLQISPSRPRRLAGWLAEKLTELKLRIDDPAGGAFRLLESLDLLASGIEGKRALWAALAAAAGDRPDLVGPDYASLQGRAVEQRDRLEALRLTAARAALGKTS